MDTSHYKRNEKGVFVKQFFNRTKVCEFCKTEFTPSPKNFKRNRFCSSSCGSRSHPSGRTGKTNTQYQKDKVKLRMSGPNHPRWIADRTIKLERFRIRNSQEWKEWRKKVFERDKYTCKECGIVGGKLEPHHIVPIRSDSTSLFSTNNGITLCRPCHQKTIWKEDLFKERYLKLILSQ